MAESLTDYILRTGQEVPVKDLNPPKEGVADPTDFSLFEDEPEPGEGDLPARRKKIQRITYTSGVKQGRVIEYQDLGDMVQKTEFNQFGEIVESKQMTPNVAEADLSALKDEAAKPGRSKFESKMVAEPRAEAKTPYRGEARKRSVITPPKGRGEFREQEFPISLEDDIDDSVFEETGGRTQRRLDLIERDERLARERAERRKKPILPTRERLPSADPLVDDRSRPTPAALRDDRRRGTTGRGKRPVTTSKRTITEQKAKPILPGQRGKRQPQGSRGFKERSRRDRFYNPRRPDVKGLPKPPEAARGSGDIELARARQQVTRDRASISATLAERLGLTVDEKTGLDSPRKRRKLDRVLKEQGTPGSLSNQGGFGVKGFVSAFDLDEAELRRSSDPEVRKLVNRLDDLDAQMFNIERLEDLSVGDRGFMGPAEGGGFSTDDRSPDQGPDSPVGDGSDRPRPRPLLTTADPGGRSARELDPTGRIRSLTEPGRFSGGRLTPDYPGLMAQRGRRRENVLNALLAVLDPDLIDRDPALRAGELDPEAPEPTRTVARPRILPISRPDVDPEFIGPSRGPSGIRPRGILGEQILAPRRLLELGDKDLATRRALAEMQSGGQGGRRLAARAQALEEVLGRAIRQQGVERAGDIGRRLQVLERVSPGLVANARSLGFTPEQILEKFSGMVERGDRTTEAIERMLSRGRTARGLSIPRGATGKIPPDLARAVMAILRRGR